MSPRSIARSKLQSGQGLVEYALIAVLVLTVLVVVFALLVGGGNNVPPPINAPLDKIITYCQLKSTSQTVVMVGDVPITNTHFHQDQFDQCLAKYEYRITR